MQRVVGIYTNYSFASEIDRVWQDTAPAGRNGRWEVQANIAPRLYAISVLAGGA